MMVTEKNMKEIFQVGNILHYVDRDKHEQIELITYVNFDIYRYSYKILKQIKGGGLQTENVGINNIGQTYLISSSDKIINILYGK